MIHRGAEVKEHISKQSCVKLKRIANHGKKQPRSKLPPRRLIEDDDFDRHNVCVEVWLSKVSSAYSIFLVSY